MTRVGRAGLFAAVIAAMLAAVWWWPRANERAPVRPTLVKEPGGPSAALSADIAASAKAASAAGAAPTPATTQPTLPSRGVAGVLAAASTSGTSADTVTAAHWMARCTAARNSSEERVLSMSTSRLEGMVGAERLKALPKRALAAQQSLVAACKALDDPALAAQGEALAQHANAQANTWAPLAGWPRKQPGESWSATQYQATVVTLGDPVHHAAALDSVLRLLPAVPAVAGGSALNSYEAEVARVLVWQELTGDRDPASVNNLSACAQRSVCDVHTAAFSQAVENRRIVAAAQQLVQLIRTQQWPAIGLRL